MVKYLTYVNSKSTHGLLHGPPVKNQDGDSQNFLRKFVRFCVTLGLKILRLFRLKVVFEPDIIKG